MALCQYAWSTNTVPNALITYTGQPCQDQCSHSIDLQKASA